MGIDRSWIVIRAVIFLGTPEFAVPTLDRIVAAGHTVSLKWSRSRTAPKAANRN